MSLQSTPKVCLRWIKIDVGYDLKNVQLHILKKDLSISLLGEMHMFFKKKRPQVDTDEYAADHLEIEQYRNSFIEDGDTAIMAQTGKVKVPTGDGYISEEQYNQYKAVYSELAQYTMIPNPNQSEEDTKSIVNTAGS